MEHHKLLTGDEIKIENVKKGDEVCGVGVDEHVEMLGLKKNFISLHPETTKYYESKIKYYINRIYLFGIFHITR